MGCGGQFHTAGEGASRRGEVEVAEERESKMTDTARSLRRWGEFGVKDSGLLIDNEWKKVSQSFDSSKDTKKQYNEHK